MNYRTCLVTGKAQDPSGLLRFTIVDGKLVFDDELSLESKRVMTSKKTKKNPGRGGYVTNDPKIIQKLPKMKGKIQYYFNVKDVEIGPISNT